MEKNFIASFFHYLGIIVKCFSGIGQWLISKKQKRIQNPVFQPLPTKMLIGFWIHLCNMPILFMQGSFCDKSNALKAFNEDLNECIFSLIVPPSLIAPPLQLYSHIYLLLKFIPVSLIVLQRGSDIRRPDRGRKEF